ncbi:MAG: glycosyltransferase family 39 protein, partial [Verrucomicrobiota bacterium]
MKRPETETIKKILLALVLFSTAGWRFLFTSQTVDMPVDVGTVGLMALDILEGERMAYMYGFPYSGALVAWLVALSFKLFGVSWFSFYLPSVLLATGWALMTFLVFQRWYGFRAGIVAAWLIAVCEWITAYYTGVPDCSYSPLYVLGTTVLWLCQRITDDPQSERRRWIHILLLGFVAGLANWTHRISVVYFMTGSLMLLPFIVRHRFHGKLLLKFVAAAAVFAGSFIPYVLTVPGDL